MNFMGMGMMELGVIFVVALLVLGPARSLDMAKTTGRLVREFRRSIADMNAAIDLDAPTPRERPAAPAPRQSEEDTAAKSGE